jgi:hypothetical protein
MANEGGGDWPGDGTVCTDSAQVELNRGCCQGDGPLRLMCVHSAAEGGG